MRHLKPFLFDCFTSATTGGRRYFVWMGTLAMLMVVGGYGYWQQVSHGLEVTGMNDYVSWGLYISNFTFLVGMAAAAIMLVLPTYVLHDVDFRRAVLIAEGVAVSALVMALSFVIANSPGTPFKWWRLLPGIGILNLPSSMMAWDVLALNGYLILNLTIPFYIIFNHYRGTTPDESKYVPLMYLSLFWAVSIHLVTAFMLAGLPAKPFWHTALLGPRFLASAFTAGPAFMILVLWFIRSETEYDIDQGAFTKLAMVTTVAAQVNLIMLGSEIFTEFYFPTHHVLSARYLFFGLDGHTALVPWIRTSVTLNICATTVLTIHPLRQNKNWLLGSCAVLFVAVWIEKGMGLVVPGYVPSPLGEIVEYSPTWVEVAVTAGIWGMGLFILTVLVKVALPIEMGQLRSPFARVAQGIEDVP